MVNTITERQAKFLTTLQEEREVDPTISARLQALRADWYEDKASSKEASHLISTLLQQPKKFDRHDLEAGIYDTGSGRLVRVYLGQQSGHMLAKEVFPIPGGGVDYVYLGLASANIPETSRRLTREEVGERTLAYGSESCLYCGRRLDDPESVDRGIGPVCWERYAS